MEKPGWIIIGAAFALFVCVVASVSIGAVSGDAVKAALADDTTANSTLRSTNVCVGLFNVGACRTQQTSTTTSTRTSGQPVDMSPWAVILVISGIVLSAVFAVAVLFLNPDAPI